MQQSGRERQQWRAQGSSARQSHHCHCHCQRGCQSQRKQSPAEAPAALQRRQLQAQLPERLCRLRSCSAQTARSAGRAGAAQLQRQQQRQQQQAQAQKSALCPCPAHLQSCGLLGQQPEAEAAAPAEAAPLAHRLLPQSPAAPCRRGQAEALQRLRLRLSLPLPPPQQQPQHAGRSPLGKAWREWQAAAPQAEAAARQRWSRRP